MNTSPYAADFGRTGGGVVSFALKSGSNTFHGTVNEFLRNSVLDANGFNANRAGSRSPASSGIRTVSRSAGLFASRRFTTAAIAPSSLSDMRRFANRVLRLSLEVFLRTWSDEVISRNPSILRELLSESTIREPHASIRTGPRVPRGIYGGSCPVT